VSGPVVVLAGGTGGAKLARGMLDVTGPDDLVVVANTADDIEIYGAHVSPDPDLVSFWLADRIDDRGWGLRDDTFHVMEGLRELGVDVWFNLGDRDLAIGIERARELRAGRTLSEAHASITAALGIRARVLPMSDQPVRTRVQADGRWWSFQEFMIRNGARGPIEGLDIRGAKGAATSPALSEAIGSARAIIIGPSNPIISIGPMLAVPSLRQAIAQASVPVVAVSPLVQGEVIKGPTAAFMAWAGHPLTSEGVCAAYAGLLDGLVADTPSQDVRTLQTDVLMDTPDARRRVAAQTLEFADALATQATG
jgi:LPPG:FO 2-phospho-L-lactate transferase